MYEPVLVLNANFEPIHVCTTRRALGLVFSGKASLVMNGRGEVKTVSQVFPRPSIIRLARMVRRPRPVVRDQEIFSKEELIAKFGLESVGRAAGVCNPDKLLWLNEHYIKTGDPERLGGLLDELLAARGVLSAGGPQLAAVVRTLQDRAKTLVEMADGATFYYRRPESYDAEAIERQVGGEQIVALDQLCVELSAIGEGGDHVAVEAAFQKVLATTGLKLGKLGPAVRIALTGGTASPGIYDVVAVLGPAESVARVQSALQIFRAALKIA